MVLHCLRIKSILPSNAFDFFWVSEVPPLVWIVQEFISKFRNAQISYSVLVLTLDNFVFLHYLANDLYSYLHFLADSTPAALYWLFIIWISSQLPPYESGLPWSFYLQATLLCHVTLVLFPWLRLSEMSLFICLLISACFSYHCIKLLRAGLMSVLFRILSLCPELWPPYDENYKVWSLTTLGCDPAAACISCVTLDRL